MGTEPIGIDSSTAVTPLARLMRARPRLKRNGVLAALGCSYHRLRSLETGGRDMTVAEAAAAAVFFGVPIETFLPPVEAAS